MQCSEMTNKYLKIFYVQWSTYFATMFPSTKIICHVLLYFYFSKHTIWTQQAIEYDFLASQ